MTEGTRLRLEQDGERWQLAGTGAMGFGLVNDFLGYLVRPGGAKAGGPGRPGPGHPSRDRRLDVIWWVWLAQTCPMNRPESADSLGLG